MKLIPSVSISKDSRTEIFSHLTSHKHLMIIERSIRLLKQRDVDFNQLD